jgi:hypothetical protein
MYIFSGNIETTLWKRETDGKADICREDRFEKCDRILNDLQITPDGCITEEIEIRQCLVNVISGDEDLEYLFIQCLDHLVKDLVPLRLETICIIS